MATHTPVRPPPTEFARGALVPLRQHVPERRVVSVSVDVVDADVSGRR